MDSDANKAAGRGAGMQYTSAPSDTALQPTVGIEMELLVLGNAAQPGVKTRLMHGPDLQFASGGRTIRAVQLIGAYLPRGIGLHGLETVITLYHNYGWRFRNSCRDQGESQRDYQVVLQLVDFFAEADADGRRGQPQVREAWILEHLGRLMQILWGIVVRVISNTKYTTWRVNQKRTMQRG